VPLSVDLRERSLLLGNDHPGNLVVGSISNDLLGFHLSLHLV
jgi:hypothetical protein